MPLGWEALETFPLLRSVSREEPIPPVTAAEASPPLCSLAGVDPRPSVTDAETSTPLAKERISARASASSRAGRALALPLFSPKCFT